MIGQPNSILIQDTDDELIKRVVAGEKELFEVIVRRYNQRLFRIGMAILGDDMETEEAMQAAYINAYEHLVQFEFRAAFGTWLTRIMLNQCYKARRDQTRVATIIPQDSENLINMKTPENVMASKELSQVLENAISQLPEKYRLVFVLRGIEDLSVRETAEIAGIETSNVKVRLNRAKTMLRENLTGYIKGAVFPFHLTRCDRIVEGVMARVLLWAGLVRKRAKARVMVNAVRPWANTVAGAPIRCEMAPTSRLPRGNIPKTAIRVTPMARPRMDGVASDWTTILQIVNWATDPNPMSTAKHIAAVK
jgi:RNA polymerase sigma-70 factor (ECF subfamily)